MARKRILLVDDEQNVLKALKRLFVDTAYKIYTANSADEGLAVFAENDIALVISDYRMPGKTGVQFLAEVRERSPQTIRIILSGFADVSSIVEAINDGQVYKFLAKPWNDQELLSTIQRAVEHYELQQENETLVNELKSANEELRRLTDNLEKQVEQRTRDLELKNRALATAQRLLSLLPAGVIGIDNQGTLVYMNAALRQYLDTSSWIIGKSLGSYLDEEPLAMLKRSMEIQQPQASIFGETNRVRAICSPLPNGVGVVGLFGYEDLEKHGATASLPSQPLEEVDANRS
jgi:two-component system NtrC family sensor kinase